MPLENAPENSNPAADRMGGVMPPRAEALSLTEVRSGEPSYVKSDIEKYEKRGYKLRPSSHNQVAHDTLRSGMMRKMREDNAAQGKKPSEWSPGAASEWKDRNTGAKGFMVSGKARNSFYFLYLDPGKEKHQPLPETALLKLAKSVLGAKAVEKDQGVYPRVKNATGVKNKAKKEAYAKAAEAIRFFEQKPNKKVGEWMDVEAPDPDGNMVKYAIVTNASAASGEIELNFYRAK